MMLFTGAYSNSAGVEVIRRDIASYIEERDGGIASDWNNIFVSTGASDGIKVNTMNKHKIHLIWLHELSIDL